MPPKRRCGGDDDDCGAAATKPRRPNKAINKDDEKAQHKARVKRSITHGILLLGVADDRESFRVQGSTGTQYTVSTGLTVSCECIDFQRRRRLCKHILFVLGRVLNLTEEQLTALGPDDVLTAEMRADLKARAAAFVQKRAERPAGREPDLECGICIEAFTPLSAIRDCQTCFHSAHVHCLRAWTLAAHKPASACPYCRSETVADGHLFVPPGGPGPQQLAPAVQLQLAPAPRHVVADDEPCWLPDG
jgi:hypothetical protein